MYANKEWNRSHKTIECKIKDKKIMMTKPREMRIETHRNKWCSTVNCDHAAVDLAQSIQLYKSKKTLIYCRLQSVKIYQINNFRCHALFFSIFQKSAEIIGRLKCNEDDPVSNRSIQLSNALTSFFDFHCHTEYQSVYGERFCRISNHCNHAVISRSTNGKINCHG